MVTLFVLMVTNATNTAAIIFSLTLLESNRPVPDTMVYAEEMVWVVMSMVEKILTMEESIMVPIATETVIAVMVTANLRPFGNIFTLLMKIQSLRFLVQPGNPEKCVCSVTGKAVFYNFSHTTSEYRDNYPEV